MTPPSRAFIAPEPFTPRVAILDVAPGSTIAAILLDAVRRCELDLEALPRVAVYIDGVSLEETIEGGRAAMLDYVPEPGAILNLAVEVAGGGGGGEKNPLQTVLQIAIIVASFWVGGPSGPLAAASAFVRTAAAVAINVGGSYALAAAFGRDGDGMKEASDRRALEGASNQFRLREGVTLQLGRERVAADMAASPYTQNVGDDTFLHLALAWHYGEATLEDVKIGETLLADYPAGDVQVEHFLTPGVPRESYLFPGSVRQENFTDQLDFAGGGVFEVHTAADGAERIEVDITLPNGLKYNADSGKTRNEEVAGLIQFAEVGTENWLPAPFPGYNTARDKNNALLPAGSWYLNLRTNEAVRRTYGWNVPDPTKQYKVRVKAYDRDNDYPGEGRTWATYWTALRAINRTRPIADQNIAVSFLRIRSSDDLNGALPTITGIVTPVVPIWSGGNWNTKAPTSNEAALARWMLTGVAAAKPLRDDQIDASAAVAYDLIEANGWGAAVQVRDDASQQDVLIRLGRAGRFSTYWNGRKLCFVTDWQKPAPRQVFTGRNAEGYRYRRTFPDPIHAVIVEFRDPESASVAGETIVYADGYNAANAELFETLRLDYSCSIERAFKEGRAYLAKRALLVESHEWTAGVDSLATTYGDRVLVRHWSNLFGEAEARVDYRHWQGGLVAGVRLDEPVTMVEGETYALDVRRADGVIRNLTLTTVAGTSRTVMFAAPRTEDLAPVKGDLVVFGKLDLVTEDVEIIDVEPSGDMTATIRAVRYIGEELVLAETGPIPPLVSGITPRPVAPRPRATGATGSPSGATVAFEVDPVRGALLDSTAVRWRRSAEDGQPENPWNTLPPLAAADRVARTPPILDAVAAQGDAGGEYRIDFELRTVLRNGSISDPEYVLDVLVAREVQTPTGITAAGYTRTNPDGSAYPVLYVQATAIEAGDIQDLVVEISNDAAAWRSAGQALPSRNPRGDYRAVQGGENVFVRAQWRTTDGWRSAWVQTPVAVAIPAGTIATDTTNVGGQPVGPLLTTIGQIPSLAAGLAATAAEVAAAELRIDQAEADVDALFSSLNTPTTGVLARLTAVESAESTSTSAAVSRLNALEATVNTPTTGVTARLAVAESAIATNNSAAVSRLSALEATVNTAGSGLSARLAVAESAIVANNAAATSRLTTLEAKARTNANRIKNPSGAVDLSFWTNAEAQGWVRSLNNRFGSWIYTMFTGAAGLNRSVYQDILVNPGVWTLSGRYALQGLTAGYVAMNVVYWNGATYLGETQVNLSAADADGVDFAPLTFTAPAGTDHVWLRPYLVGVSGSPVTAYFGFYRVKLEEGAVATPFTDDASDIDLSARTAVVENAVADLETGKAEVERVDILEARVRSRTNLLKNPTGKNGFVSWSNNLGGDAAWQTGVDRDFGPWFFRPMTGAGPVNSYWGQEIPAGPGQTLVLSGERYVNGLTAGNAFVEIAYFNGATYLSGASYNVPLGATILDKLPDISAASPAGTNRAMIYFGVYGAVGAPGFAYVGFWRMKVETGTISSPWSDETDAVDLRAGVAEVRLATATLEGRVEASSTLLVTAGNRVSGVRFLAVDGPDSSYSSVDFLADVFRVWSPEQTLGVAPFEIRGGTVRMRDAIVDRLAVGASIVIGSRRLAVAVQPFPVQVTDGVPITYGYSIGAAPDLVFLRDGAIQQPAAGESFNFYAESSTGSGFTPRLKLTTAGTPTNQTAGPGGTASGPAEKHFALAGAAAGNTVSVRVTGVIESEFVNPNYNPGSPPMADDGVSYSDGYLTIAVFGYAGGWTQIGTLDVYPAFRSSWSDPPGTYNDAFDTGLNAFAVSPSTTHVGVAVLYESHAGSYISNLSLAYQTAGSSGTRSATPNGELTTVMVYPKNSL